MFQLQEFLGNLGEQFSFADAITSANALKPQSKEDLIDILGYLICVIGDNEREIIVMTMVLQSGMYGRDYYKTINPPTDNIEAGYHAVMVGIEGIMKETKTGDAMDILGILARYIDEF